MLDTILLITCLFYLYYLQSEDKRNFEAKMIHGTTEIVLGHIVYDQENRRLTLVNHNTELQGKVLLLGYTHKSGHHDVIGQFGELFNAVM